MSLPLRLRKSLELVVGPAPADFCSAIAEADLSIVRTNGGKVREADLGPARSECLLSALYTFTLFYVSKHTLP